MPLSSAALVPSRFAALTEGVGGNYPMFYGFLVIEESQVTFVASTPSCMGEALGHTSNVKNK